MLLGYSFLTSQYGLAVDNVAGYELVLPNGTITNVTSKDCDLWFGLRVSM
jgi:FAD/FMN-containing dehydrogenase